MNGSLAAECLALATGIFPKRPPSLADVNRASKIHARVETALRAFLRADKPEKWESWQRPPDQDELHEQLCTPVDGKDWIAEWLPPEVMPQWLIVINQARKYVADKWPIWNADSFTPANYSLSRDEYGDMWELVRSIDGEENFLADLRSHVLSPAQVEAMKACYPDFYETCFASQSTDVVPVLFEQLVSLATQKKSLTWQQEDMVRVLLGMPDEAAITVSQPAPPPRQPSNPRPSRMAGQSRTRNENIEAGESR